MLNVDVDGMSCEGAKYLLRTIIDKLDELERMNFFGSEGWKTFFDIEEY